MQRFLRGIVGRKAKRRRIQMRWKMVFGVVIACLSVFLFFQLPFPTSAQGSTTDTQVTIDRSLLFQVRGNQAKEEVQDGEQMHFVAQLPNALTLNKAKESRNSIASGISFSYSGCLVSFCLASECVGSGCAFSGCVLSVCYYSNCFGSHCVTSGCWDSSCAQSTCESVCAPSACATYCASCGGTVCDSSCQQSICWSTCPTQCGGGKNCQMLIDPTTDR
jgi:hypothetical protein